MNASTPAIRPLHSSQTVEQIASIISTVALFECIPLALTFILNETNNKNESKRCRNNAAPTACIFSVLFRKSESVSAAQTAILEFDASGLRLFGSTIDHNTRMLDLHNSAVIGRCGVLTWPLAVVKFWANFAVVNWCNDEFVGNPVNCVVNGEKFIFWNWNLRMENFVSGFAFEMQSTCGETSKIPNDRKMINEPDDRNSPNVSCY